MIGLTDISRISATIAEGVAKEDVLVLGYHRCRIAISVLIPDVGGDDDSGQRPAPRCRNWSGAVIAFRKNWSYADS